MAPVSVPGHKIKVLQVPSSGTPPYPRIRGHLIKGPTCEYLYFMPPQGELAIKVLEWPSVSVYGHQVGPLPRGH